MVRPKGNQPLDERTVRTLKQMVASSVAGLKPEAVTVVDMSTNDHFGASGADGANGGDYADHKKRHELAWQHTISHVLEYIPGVLVSTNVELDPEISNEETSIQFDKEPARRDASKSAKPHSASESPKGSSAHLAEVVADELGLSPREKREGNSLPATQTHVVRQGGTPKRVTVSVAVPNTYYFEVWHKENAAPAGQPQRTPDAASLAAVEAREKQKIEQLVANLLPREESAARDARQVAVSTFYPLTHPPVADPELSELVMAWAVEHGGTLALGGMALLGLLVLRSMVRSIGGPARRAAAALPDLPPTFSVVDDTFEDTRAQHAPEEPVARRHGAPQR